MSVNSKMTAIADAIRGKTGGTEVLTLDAMAVAIKGIEVGGGNTLEFEEKELSFAPLAEDDLPMNLNCGLTELKEGATYDVTWDGTVYTCKVHRVDADGAYILAMGNGAFITGEADEVPFMFMYDAMGVMGMPSNVIVASLDENPTHTVGVKFNFTAGGGTGGDAENDTPFALITATTQRGGNAVAGAAVTATNGTTQITGTTDENGQCVLKVSESGTYTITSTYDGYTSTSTAVTVGSLSYTASVKFFGATITVETETGATVTVEKDGKVQTAVSEDMCAVIPVYEAGDYTVTTSYNGETKTEVITVTSETNYTVSMFLFHYDLENTTWNRINEISAEGNPQNYFAVGDTKSVELKGTIGTVVFDTTLLVYILGFNHNSSVEGNGIHFGGFKTTDGVDVALVDSNYGTTIKSTTPNYMKTYSFGEGSQAAYYQLVWKVFYGGSYFSDFKNTSISGAGTRYDFTNTMKEIGTGIDSFIGAIPVELKNVLKPFKKHYSRVMKRCEMISHVQLLTTKEIFGVSNTDSYSEDYAQQYKYYADGNSTIKYKHNDTATACRWLTRTIPSGLESVKEDGSVGTSVSTYAYGLAPIFVV